ncbi:PepSY domain-containing protein [Mesonia aestuariivivens]|uniref:PepSY domain-containing protein n=1 Tax=Mesonia aestuariivivens TaxID=2796128 RepID=A0ABS6W4F1_9FLAO|nr:PepSY domain-containing protein [Mesonia aestuariivivens]MBW2961964.1 PepSY domain-containing protein [Mesonia aestuariivivens]
MIISAWRYSHLALAVSSFLFVLMASLTGIILAFEPIQQEIEINSFDLDQITAATLIDNLQENYLEVFEVKVDGYDRVSISALTENGDLAEFYVNPNTGEKVAEINPEAKTFQFARSLHRSLFLKTTGRFFVALTSFLLFLISLSGLILFLKRQQGVKKIFSTIIKENFYQYGHVYLGRLFLIPIIIISLSGVYLSLFQFNILEHPVFTAEVENENINAAPKRAISDFEIFNNTSVANVKSIEFPFSSAPSDYFMLQLKDGSFAINQFTGEILDEDQLSAQEQFFQYSYILHTGEGNFIWAFILLLSCVSILFFIYSGFKITFKRKATKIKNKFKLNDCTHLILVGSETGSTLQFAVWFQQELLKKGKKAYVQQMNEFSYHNQLEQLIIFTATYGVGEPPTNANKFEAKLKEISFGKPIQYSVVGFGSFAYPDFCKFAYTTESLLDEKENAECFLALHTINNKSAESFNRWLAQWARLSEMNFPKFEGEVDSTKQKKLAYEVVRKTEIIPNHQTFLVELKPIKRQKLRSGDLLAVSPGEKHHDRLYSLGITLENTILLSIKLHRNGICSTYLNSLKQGDVVQASRLKNKSFYFPKKASQVLMVATGTGIAPFLGMLMNNSKKTLTKMYWGARDEEALIQYKNMITSALENQRLAQFIPVYSRTDQQQYVQNRLQENDSEIAEVLQAGGVIMICGSIFMQQAVLALLTKICEENKLKNLSDYQNRGQLLMDCY